MANQVEIGPVVVAVDFSAESESALLAAAGSAGTTPDNPLVVLHVAHEPAHAPGFYHRREPNDSMRSIEELARRMLGEFMTDMRARHPQVAQLQHVREEVVSGLPETRITELAKNIGAQKIVIGCSGISELRKLWFGSVSGRVERDSEIPVQVINAHSTASDIRSLTR